uniref:Uncharacterized protein n=1 Tax=Meloidogyne enterolobii TaxID=390850 RepID=A0A6V7X3C7_MELEN|nr:unnamed protein product [Meloidogyne enterolobii]
MMNVLRYFIGNFRKKYFLLKQLKNKENGFGKKCKKPRQHAIEMRVCARRKSFERDNDRNEYKIEYNVYSKIGFSFTHKR